MLQKQKPDANGILSVSAVEKVCGGAPCLSSLLLHLVPFVSNLSAADQHAPLIERP